MSKNIEWITGLHRNVKVKSLPCQEVLDHPLKSATIIVTEKSLRNLSSQPSTGRTTPTSILEPLSAALEGTDPLTQFVNEQLDPLSQIATENNASSYNESASCKKNQQQKLDMDSWHSRKASILAKFTTSEKLSIVSSFLSEGEKVVIRAQTSAVDKVQHRLAQLDDLEEGAMRLDVSQAEYAGRIEQLSRELVMAWHGEQRVKALKIAIQSAKMLADTSVLHFYPSQFVLVTDILDKFGELIFNRLKVKAVIEKPGIKARAEVLPDNFTIDMVSESAKETCRNWFYKIASIRELVPRLYVEMAILKSYRFLTSKEYSSALLRLTKMITGIGDPLVAVYARCYLCRVGITIMEPGMNKNFLKENFNGFLATYNQLFCPSVQEELQKQKLDISLYLILYTPALDFILQACTADGSDYLLSELLECSRRKENNALILNTIMAAFKPIHISNRSLQFLELIQQDNMMAKESFPTHILYRTLGLCLCVSPPPMEFRRQLLISAWNRISTIGKTEYYINCAEVWLQLAVMYLNSREVESILKDVLQHLSPSRAFEQFYPQLESALSSIISHSPDVEALLTLDHFLPFLDLFQGPQKVEGCKRILAACNHTTSDPVAIDALFFLCRTLHDSITALTVDDEHKQVSNLIAAVVRRVNYGRDFEQQLSFYVEARSLFCNLDLVLIQLVHCVNRLSVDTRKIVKGYHTRKTGAFVRACAAYCFITIPSIASVTVRLELYLLSGQIALFNGILGQADACFKTAVELIPEVDLEEDKKNEFFLSSYIRNVLSTLLVVPDNPEKGVLYLVRHLLNTLQRCHWDLSPGLLSKIYLFVLDLLSAASQETFIYHVDKVESNDALYGSDPKFLQEINKMCTIIIGEILEDLKKLGPNKKQSALALQLAFRVLARGNLEDEKMATLTVNLWQLSVRNGQHDMKLMERTKDYFMQKFNSPSELSIKELISNLQIPIL